MAIAARVHRISFNNRMPGQSFLGLRRQKGFGLSLDSLRQKTTCTLTQEMSGDHRAFLDVEMIKCCYSLS